MAAAVVPTKDISPVSEKDAERFFNYVQKTDSCWLWTGAVNTNGYGAFSLQKRARQAHRVSYAIANDGLPADAYVCHSCDTKLCVNPEHLHLGTHKSNIEEAVERKRYRHGDQHWSRRRPELRSRGETHGNSTLTATAVREIRKRASSGETHQSLALEFNVGQAQITRIVNRQRWAHVADEEC